MSENTFPKLHNAMWPGLVGKGDDEGMEPPLSLEHMLDLTAAAEVLRCGRPGGACMARNCGRLGHGRR